MKRLTFILATALMMTACAGGDAAKVPAIDKANFDESISLKENFYQWATGGCSSANHQLPTGRSSP